MHKNLLSKYSLQFDIIIMYCIFVFQPMIQVASKYERRVDTRSYDDKKKLFEGGLDTFLAEISEKTWKSKYETFTKRGK
uniref:Uncharacterized protein n=1 Tax=Timema tahoe TaxID=61484 RepID=A0A7R9P1B2_9NEOP|nr:unnamed protein product [Timema tahoe]